VAGGRSGASGKFTQTKSAPSYGKAVCYAKDAMNRSAVMNELMDLRRERRCGARTVKQPVGCGNDDSDDERDCRR